MARHEAYLKTAADKVRSSGFVLPVFFVFFVLALMSIAFSWVDYWTSYEGYLALPTRKYNDWIPYVVALSPQVVQIAAGYITLTTSTEEDVDFQRIFTAAFLFWIAFLAIDVWTDVTFRITLEYTGEPWKMYLAAIAETVGLYTIASEVFFVVGFGMCWELMVDTLAQIRTLPLRLQERMAGIRERFKHLVEEEMR